MYIMEKWFNEVVRRATQTYGMMMRGIQPDLRKHFSVATAEEVRKFFDETLKIKKNNMWKLTMTTEIKRMISFDQFKLANATAWVAATQFKKRCKGNYSECESPVLVAHFICVLTLICIFRALVQFQTNWVTWPRSGKRCTGTWSRQWSYGRCVTN